VGETSQSEIESHLLDFAKEKDRQQDPSQKEATVRTHWSWQWQLNSYISSD